MGLPPEVARVTTSLGRLESCPTGPPGTDRVPRDKAGPPARATDMRTPFVSRTASTCGTALLAVRLLLLLTGAAASGPSLAYVDPNAGGWLFQLLFPALVAIGAAWAGLRTRIALWWSRWSAGRGRKSTDVEARPHERAIDRDDR